MLSKTGRISRRLADTTTVQPPNRTTIMDSPIATPETKTKIEEPDSKTVYSILILIVAPIIFVLLFGGASAFTASLIFVAVYYSLFGAHYYRTAKARLSELALLKQENRELSQKIELITTELTDVENETREKSRFLAAASHDLRQPLQSIGLLLYSLENRLDDPDIKELIVDLEKSHKSMNDLFGSLLEISKIDSNTIEVNRSSVSLQKIFTTLETELKPLAAEKKLELSVPKTSSYISTDEILLSRIIRNLLHNAIVHTDAGTIQIELDQSQKSISIKITDTGPGIPEEELKNIFSEFYQLKSSKKKGGVGLGLSIVSRLCILLGHDISVNSELGSGTTFELRVALASPPANASAGSNQNLHAYQDKIIGLSILVIDDDPINLKATSNALKSWGANTYTAQTGEEAQRIFSANSQISFVVFDYHLSTTTGVKTYARFKQMGRMGLSGLLVTGDANPGILKEAQQLQVQVLPKPVQPAKLRNAINRSLDLASKQASSNY